MLRLNELERLNKKRKRIGRGGSRGGTSGKGGKGQLARTGGRSEIKPFFEGGQMPLSRRLPKRGFTNVFKKEYSVINLVDLEERFSSGDHVNETTLREKGLLKGKKRSLIKVLGTGTLSKSLTVSVHAVSKSAIEAIKGAHGTVELTGEIASGSVAS